MRCCDAFITSGPKLAELRSGKTRALNPAAAIDLIIIPILAGVVTPSGMNKTPSLSTRDQSLSWFTLGVSMSSATPWSCFELLDRRLTFLISQKIGFTDARRAASRMSRTLSCFRRRSMSNSPYANPDCSSASRTGRRPKTVKYVSRGCLITSKTLMNDAFHENIRTRHRMSIRRSAGCQDRDQKLWEGVATEAGTKHCAKPKKSAVDNACLSSRVVHQ